jgi:hypothetical protein
MATRERQIQNNLSDNFPEKRRPVSDGDAVIVPAIRLHIQRTYFYLDKVPANHYSSSGNTTSHKRKRRKNV